MTSLETNSIARTTPIEWLRQSNREKVAAKTRFCTEVLVVVCNASAC